MHFYLMYGDDNNEGNAGIAMDVGICINYIIFDIGGSGIDVSASKSDFAIIEWP